MTKFIELTNYNTNKCVLLNVAAIEAIVDGGPFRYVYTGCCSDDAEPFSVTETYDEIKQMLGEKAEADLCTNYGCPHRTNT